MGTRRSGRIGEPVHIGRVIEKIISEYDKLDRENRKCESEHEESEDHSGSDIEDKSTSAYQLYFYSILEAED